MNPTHPLPAHLPAHNGQPIYSGQAQVWIAAAPETVYALVSDLTRMGEFSPECFRVEWLEGAAAPAIGVQARGWNRFLGITWARNVVILAAQPGVEFTFQTIPERPFYQDSTIWRYRFAPQDGGTLLTESYAIVFLSSWMHLFEKITRRPEKAPQGLHTTLTRIKAAAER